MSELGHKRPLQLTVPEVGSAKGSGHWGFECIPGFGPGPASRFCGALTGCAHDVHHVWPRGRLLLRALTCGVTVMMENIVRGFVIVALIIMVTLAYAQKHEGCLRGRSLETFQPCGSVGVDM